MFDGDITDFVPRAIYNEVRERLCKKQGNPQ